MLEPLSAKGRQIYRSPIRSTNRHWVTSGVSPARKGAYARKASRDEMCAWQPKGCSLLPVCCTAEMSAYLPRPPGRPENLPSYSHHRPATSGLPISSGSLPQLP
jgi:hypothetical protein